MNPSLMNNFQYFEGDCVQKFGLDQVQIWRRSYDIPPPPMESSHPFYKDIINHPAYQVLVLNNSHHLIGMYIWGNRTLRTLILSLKNKSHLY